MKSTLIMLLAFLSFNSFAFESGQDFAQSCPEKLTEVQQKLQQSKQISGRSLRLVFEASMDSFIQQADDCEDIDYYLNIFDSALEQEIMTQALARKAHEQGL